MTERLTLISGETHDVSRMKPLNILKISINSLISL